jgi:hypothetical protein
MKAFFHYSRFLLLCIGIIFLSQSCSRYLPTHSGPKIEKKVFIRITGNVPGSTTNLIMLNDSGKPADTFDAYSEQKVIWKIEDKAEIKSIKIYSKDSSLASVSIYKKGPKRRFLSKNLKGKLIKTDVKLKEYYNIYWTDKNGHLQHFDPLMQLNPTK